MAFNWIFSQWILFKEKTKILALFDLPSPLYTEVILAPKELSKELSKVRLALFQIEAGQVWAYMLLHHSMLSIILAKDEASDSLY